MRRSCVTKICWICESYIKESPISLGTQIEEHCGTFSNQTSTALLFNFSLVFIFSCPLLKSRILCAFAKYSVEKTGLIVRSTKRSNEQQSFYFDFANGKRKIKTILNLIKRCSMVANKIKNICTGKSTFLDLKNCDA